MQRYAKSIGAEGGNLSDLLANMKDRKAKFTFALDGETGFAHEGELRFGDNRVDPSTGTMQVYGMVPNAERHVRSWLAGARAPDDWQAVPGNARAGHGDSCPTRTSGTC